METRADDGERKMAYRMAAKGFHLADNPHVAAFTVHSAKRIIDYHDHTISEHVSDYGLYVPSGAGTSTGTFLMCELDLNMVTGGNRDTIRMKLDVDLLGGLRANMAEIGLQSSALSDGHLLGLLFHIGLSYYHDWKPGDMPFAAASLHFHAAKPPTVSDMRRSPAGYLVAATREVRSQW